MSRIKLALAGLIGSFSFSGAAIPQNLPEIPASVGLCGPLENSYGPFDYRTIPPDPKYLVESAHFPPKVETLRGGNRGYLGGDIDYTLRAIPNHHRALMAMARLAERTGRTRPTGANYPVECYFDRAERFASDDPMVHVLYGIFLAKANRKKEAEGQLAAAEQLGSNDPQVVYNLGLGYLKLEQYDRAVEFAKKAESLGIQLPGLRQSLQRVDKWPN